MRSEKDIFDDLKKLATSKGYLYALIWIVFNEDMIFYEEEVKESDMEHLHSNDRLIRTEISTLAGLLITEDVNLDTPSNDEFESYINITHKLLGELHDVISEPYRIKVKELANKGSSPKSLLLRETFFYDGESAYYFQFRDLVGEKYRSDNDWFINNKAFTVDQYKGVLNAICEINKSKLCRFDKLYKNGEIDIQILLDMFTISLDDISNYSGYENKLVENIVREFTSNPPCNQSFSHINDFNLFNAKPLITIGVEKYCLLQIYGIAEAFYESPYYWMLQDKKYRDIAFKNRGVFSEDYTKNKLENIFGKTSVFKNVKIYEGKNETGEIDVLVSFSDRAIVIQNKSKKLTLEARKGNDEKIQEDFYKSVQSSYDQASLCSKVLGKEGYKFTTKEGVELKLKSTYKEIYPICIVLDVYPALNYQVRQLLKYESNVIIQPPLVLDIFMLDVFTEFLISPIRFLSYINTRTNYLEMVSSNKEFAVLSFHLKRNLFFDGEFNYIDIDDAFSSSLDMAMMARRDGLDARDTPEGILTKYKNTIFWRFMALIEHEESEALINLGFLLLRVSGETIELINSGLNQIIEAAKRDNESHDFGFGIEGSGITYHCNSFVEDEAIERLIAHAQIKKYQQKSNSWFAILIAPSYIPEIRFCIHMNDQWQHSSEMDEIANTFFQAKKKATKPDKLVVALSKKYKDKKKKMRKASRKARRKN